MRMSGLRPADPVLGASLLQECELLGNRCYQTDVYLSGTEEGDADAGYPSLGDLL